VTGPLTGPRNKRPYEMAVKTKGESLDCQSRNSGIVTRHSRHIQRAFNATYSS
jgi:hypothetical protein